MTDNLDHLMRRLIAEAQEMGHRAGTAAYSLKRNPYSPGTTLWCAWRDGWARALEDAQHDDPA